MPDPRPKSSSRLFSRPVFVRVIFAVACLVTLIAIFDTEENWRGKRVWENCRKELEAKGVVLNWQARIPPPVPDEQNMFKAPQMTEWFVKTDRSGGFSNTLSARWGGAIADCLARWNTNAIAEVTIVPLAAEVAPARADIILKYQNSILPSADPAQSEALRGLVRSFSFTSDSTEPRLKGAQGYYTFVAKPHRPVTPLRVIVRADHLPGTKEVADFFPRNLFAEPALGGRLRVESRGTSQFEVFLSDPTICAAADYLACTEQLAPDLDLIRSGLQRPYARRDGDYQRSWAIPIQNFVAIRTTVQILAQRAQCDLLLGKPEAALREMTLMHDVCRLLDSKPVTLVAAMINVAVRGLYVAIIADGLRLHAWGEPQLVDLQRQLAQIELLGPLVEAMDNERVSACHMFETTKPGDLENIFAFGRDNPDIWWRIRDPNFWALHCMPRGWFYQNMAALASREQLFIEAIDPSRQLIATKKVDEAGNESISWVSRPSPYAVLARVAMPNYLKACKTVAHNQTMANEALVACGLERYRLAHNAYPEALADLGPGLLPKLPREVVTGEPLKYRRSGSDKFLLYSVGWNGTDMGGLPGKAVTEGDWVWEGN